MTWSDIIAQLDGRYGSCFDGRYWLPSSLL
jgi:hypothetical protein